MSTSSSHRPPKAVLLDRDGTVITETGYLTDPDGFALVPGAAEAIARLNRASIPVALVTNQSAIARGWLTPEVLDQIHGALAERLADEDAHLDSVYYCPHHPSEAPEGMDEGPWTTACDCRKPLPGMLHRALEGFGVAPADAVTIGDSDRDLQAGERAGVDSILVGTGKGAAEWRKSLARTGRAPLFVPDLAAAVELLL